MQVIRHLWQLVSRPQPLDILNHQKAEVVLAMKSSRALCVRLAAFQLLLVSEWEEKSAIVEAALKDSEPLIRIQASLTKNAALLVSGLNDSDQLLVGTILVKSIFASYRQATIAQDWLAPMMGFSPLQAYLDGQEWRYLLQEVEYMLQGGTSTAKNLILRVAADVAQPSNMRSKAILLLGVVAGEEAMELLKDLKSDSSVSVADCAHTVTESVRQGVAYPYNTLIQLW